MQNLKNCKKKKIYIQIIVFISILVEHMLEIFTAENMFRLKMSVVSFIDTGP
jgi:hypothetical protein